VKEDSATRKRTVADRMKRHSSAPLAATLGNIITFWMSHVAVGIVAVESVFIHLFHLIQLAEEHSTDFVARYERLLMVKLHCTLRSDPQSFRVRPALERVDSDIVADLVRESLIARASEAARAKVADRKQPEARKIFSPTRRDKTQDAPPASEQPAKGGGRQSGGTSQPPQPDAKVAAARTKRQVCFSHDPAKGTRCSDAQCQASKDHLDTAQPALRTRFDQAKAAYDRRQAAGKGSR